MREHFLHRTQYDDPSYLSLLGRYRAKRLEVPLSEYLKIKKGVCRESALLTVLALNSLGLESYYYYAKVTNVFNGIEKFEDHAVSLVNINATFFTVDNYFRAFNGKPLDDVQSLAGVGSQSGLMYDAPEASVMGRSYIHISRTYPEVRHNSRHL